MKNENGRELKQLHIVVKTTNAKRLEILELLANKVDSTMNQVIRVLENTFTNFVVADAIDSFDDSFKLAFEKAVITEYDDDELKNLMPIMKKYGEDLGHIFLAVDNGVVPELYLDACITLVNVVCGFMKKRIAELVTSVYGNSDAEGVFSEYDDMD